MAIADYTKYLEIDPNNSEVYYDRGLQKFTQVSDLDKDKKRYDSAIADYSKAIELDPKYAEAYLSRAEAYRKLGKKDLAQADTAKHNELKGKKQN